MDSKRQTIFSVGNSAAQARFFVFELRGLLYLSYTDDPDQAMKFPTELADWWGDLIKSLVDGGLNVERIDLPQEILADMPLSND